jgi:DNA polymerase-3 subunit delta
MHRIKEHIRNHQFSRCYLLYGEESYLKNLYKNQLKAAVLGDGGDMNFSYWEGKGISVTQLVNDVQTLPFFHDFRFVLVENSGFFKSQNDLADFMKDFPDSTVLVFVENEIDKRNRLYKAVSSLGTVCEMNGMDEKNLKLWAASLLAREHKKIRESDLTYLFEKSGTDMELLVRELEKLESYVGEREIIERSDIDEICTTQVTSRIFVMIDDLAAGNVAGALHLYKDLLANREKPMSILFLITRHFNILLQMKEAERLRLDDKTAAGNAGVPPFAVRKYRGQAGNFSEEQLKHVLDECLRLENDVKVGKMDEQIAVELVLAGVKKG